MMEIKGPIYNILNFLLTGLVFVGCGLLMYPDYAGNFILSEYYDKITAMSETLLLLCIVAIAYEIGFVLNRAGSVFIEPVFKKLKIIPFNDDYKLYNDMSKEYPIMKVLSREYALSRTSSLLFALLFISSLFSGKKIYMMIFALCTVMFVLSCRKHATKIVTLMEAQKG